MCLTQFNGSWDYFSWCRFTHGWDSSSWSLWFGYWGVPFFTKPRKIPKMEYRETCCATPHQTSTPREPNQDANPARLCNVAYVSSNAKSSQFCCDPEMLINCQMWTAYPQNTHSSQGESQLYIFEDNEAVIQNDHQMQKSNNETRIQNPQSCSSLVVWQNQSGSKDSNQIRRHQTPTRRHVDKGQFSHVMSWTIFTIRLTSAISA